MKREERFELRYIMNGTERVCYPRSIEKKDSNLRKCKERGIKVVSCKKLYPFNTEKNQHNFMLIENVCRNRMDDMNMGEIPYNEAEYNELEKTAEKAGELFCLELPIAWLPWEQWKDAKEIAERGILHRQNACIEAGRLDLVQYC